MQKLRILFFLMVTISSVPAAIASNSSKEDVDEDFKRRIAQQVKCEKKLAELLESITECKMAPYSSVHCKLSYKGLKLEFAGINQRGTIYIFKLGKGQVLSTFGRNCLSIKFNERCELAPPELLFFEDGNITNRMDNYAAWRACE